MIISPWSFKKQQEHRMQVSRCAYKYFRKCTQAMSSKTVDCLAHVSRFQYRSAERYVSSCRRTPFALQADWSQGKTTRCGRLLNCSSTRAPPVQHKCDIDSTLNLESVHSGSGLCFHFHCIALVEGVRFAVVMVFHLWRGGSRVEPVSDEGPDCGTEDVARSSRAVPESITIPVRQ